MASEQVPAVLVARFLKAHHYNKTLESFLKETNLPEKAANIQPGDWTLEKLVQEKFEFDVSLNFERHGTETKNEWTTPAPSEAHSPEFSINTNVLCIRGHPEQNLLAISTADNTCTLVDGKAPYSPLPNRYFKADGPILSTLFTEDAQLAATTMSGKLITHDLNTTSLLSEVRHHSKWAVSSAYYFDHNSSTHILATAGWDQKVHIYALPTSSTSPSNSPKDTIPEPVHTISLPTNPESLFFTTNPDTHQLNLILSRRDSTFLNYYSVTIITSSQSLSPPASSSDSSPPKITVQSSGTQNLAPHSNAWVTFTPSCLALSPRDPTLLAIATAHLPHLKVMIVRLLFPDSNIHSQNNPPPDSSYASNSTPAAAARASLALQDIEDKAIMIQASTMAPQTPYSTPQVVWRPDGSGVWVNGDDGVVRGVEVVSGKVVSFLRAHEAGSKIRTLWAGHLGSGAERREVVVSGGFDRRVFVWEVKGEGGR